MEGGIEMLVRNLAKRQAAAQDTTPVAEQQTTRQLFRIEGALSEAALEQLRMMVKLAGATLTEETVQPLPTDKERVLHFIQEHAPERISAQQIASALEIGVDSVRVYCSKLVNAGLVRRLKVADKRGKRIFHRSFYQAR
jgi:hypothetical protein